MIDWWGLGANLLWVVGLAIGLAAFSMAHYRTRTTRVSLQQGLGEVGFQLPFCIGMVLFGCGLLLSGQGWWEKMAGGLVLAGCLLEAVRLWKCRRTDLPQA